MRFKEGIARRRGVKEFVVIVVLVVVVVVVVVGADGHDLFQFISRITRRHNPQVESS